MRPIRSESDNRRDGVAGVTMPEAWNAMESHGIRRAGSVLPVRRFRVGTRACGVQEGRSQCHLNNSQVQSSSKVSPATGDSRTHGALRDTSPFPSETNLENIR
jgi:hypothetical protein